MKKLLTAILLCAASLSASAQAKSLKVVNNTGCTVYYSVLGDYAPSCLPAYGSAFISFPGATVFYSNPAAVPIPPLTTTDNINGAKVFASLPSCPRFTSFAVGEPCSGFPSVVTYVLFASSCNVCGTTTRTAKWIPADPTGLAYLIFN